MHISAKNKSNNTYPNSMINETFIMVNYVTAKNPTRISRFAISFQSIPVSPYFNYRFIYTICNFQPSYIVPDNPNCKPKPTFCYFEPYYLKVL